MEKNFLGKLIISTFIFLLIGCGGGSGATTNNENKAYIDEDIINDPITLQAKQFNASNLLEKINNLNNDNYIEVYQNIDKLKLVGIPNIKDTFEQFNKLKKANSEKTQRKRTNKVLNCLVSGTATININLIGRSNFEADTYKTGDEYQVFYNNCNMGNTTYRGTKTYHVNSFSQFDFSKVGAGDPIGEFETRYNQYSVETITHKLIINGTFIYKGKASYSSIPNSSPTSLSKSFSAISGATLLYKNKSTSVETNIIYSKYKQSALVLNEIKYTKKLLTENDYRYCKKHTYNLTLKEENNEVTLPVVEHICGDVVDGLSNELLSPVPTGLDYDPVEQIHSGQIKIGRDRVIVFPLVNGNKRYILELNYFTASSIISASTDVETSLGIKQLPLTDNNLNLINGVVIFAFEGCPNYEATFNFLNEKNIPYTYIDIRNTTVKNRAAFDWFNSQYVPYIGINGNYFLNSGLIIKNMVYFESIGQ